MSLTLNADGEIINRKSAPSERQTAVKSLTNQCLQRESRRERETRDGEGERG